MSKKKKKKLKKLKKKKKQQVQKEQKNIQPQKTDEVEVEVPEKKEGKLEEDDENIYEEIYKDQKYSYIKRDVIKVLVVLVALIILLFAIYFLDKTYSFLGPVGEWLYKILNIQTQ